MNETLPNAVLCVGMLNCDVYFRNTPKNLMRTDTSFMRDVTMLVGGDAANVSQNLAHMGITSYLAANVAGDVFGAACLRHARRRRRGHPLRAPRQRDRHGREPVFL